MKRPGIVLILLLAFFGIADSAYIAQSERAGTPLLCTIQNLTGCNTVAQSGYSYFLGIPVAEYGILFYSIIFVLAALELVVFDQLLRRALMWLSVVGALVSLYLAALQAFVIRAFCIYCVVSVILAILIFILAMLIHIRGRQTHHIRRAHLPPFFMPPR